MKVVELYNTIVDSVYKNDMEYQLACIETFCEHIRVMPLEILLKYRAFYVPNNNYLYEATEGVALGEEYGLYRGNECFFSGRLVIPIPDFMGNVRGFVGYDSESEDNASKYLYSVKSVFKKKRFTLIRPEIYRQALEDNYICICDGIFDGVMLDYNNYNACSLLGTFLSDYHIQYLRHIKYWIVFRDQDRAGTELYRYAMSVNPNTIAVDPRNTKDIDARLRESGGAEELAKLFERMRREGFMLGGVV